MPERLDRLDLLDAPTRALLATVRREFQLREGVAFLNHGSFGACPRPVFAVYQQWQRELEDQPVEFLGRRLTGLLTEARTALADYLGTTAANLVFVPNATTGVNIVARSLALQPGDEVLGTDHEYGAVERTWRYLCGSQGATYRAQPLPLPVIDADMLVDQFWQGVTARTRLIVLSHITSRTALILPLERIVERARAAGIPTLVDGAHAPGQIDLWLDTLGADFYAGNCHKWLCAPKGAGFLYARPERQDVLRPLVVSWGWEAEEPSGSRFQDYFGWVGTSDPASYLTVPAAIAFERAHDWPTVRAACHALAATTRERIASLTGLPLVCPNSPVWFAQMAVAPLPVNRGVDAKDLQRRLWERHGVEVPVHDWEDWRFVRVSVQAYNTEEDIERLLTALAAEL